MSFGGPGGRQFTQKPTPPERGSFPLDHFAECKDVMTAYLRCLRTYKGDNADECRGISKAYLQCRMDRNLMAPDDMRNLGFADKAMPSSVQAKGSGGDSGGGNATRPAASS